MGSDKKVRRIAPKTVFLDETASLVMLLPRRRLSSEFCVWRLEDVASTSGVQVVLSKSMVSRLARDLVGISKVGKGLLDVYERRASPRSKPVGFYYRFLKALRGRIPREDQRQILTRLLACVQLLSRTWLSSKSERHLRDLRSGFSALERRARQYRLLRQEMLAEPEPLTNCNTKTASCPRRKLLDSFCANWGSGLLRQGKSFLDRAEIALKTMAVEGAKRAGVPLSMSVKGSTASRAYTWVHCCDCLAQRRPQDALACALAVWSWDVWLSLQGVRLMGETYKECLFPTSSTPCGHRWCEAATIFALGTIRAWNKKGAAWFEQFKGADALFSFDRRLQFCRLLAMRHPTEHKGVECRRDHRFKLGGAISIESMNQWRSMELVDIGLFDKGFAVRSDTFRPAPYSDMFPVKVTGREAERWYVPLWPDTPPVSRFRYLFDLEEDPIQAFVAAR